MSSPCDDCEGKFCDICGVKDKHYGGRSSSSGISEEEAMRRDGVTTH